MPIWIPITLLFSMLIASLSVDFRARNIIILVLIVLFPIMVLMPNTFFLSYILIRPVLDQWMRETLFGSLKPSTLYAVVLLVICGKGVFSIRNLKRLKRNKFMRNCNILFLAFCGMAALSSLYSVSTMASLQGLFRIFSIGLVFNFVYLNFRSRKQQNLLLVAFILSSLIPVFVGMMQLLFSTGPTTFDNVFRLRSTFSHPHLFGQYLLVVASVTFYLISQKPRKGLFLVLIPYAGLILFQLFHTYSRTTWISLAAALLVIGLLKTRFVWKMFFVVTMALVIFCAYPYIAERFQDLGSFNSRVLTWRICWEGWKQHPFIGYGLWSLESAYGQQAHNVYLKLAYEVGSIGLVLYCSWLAYIVFFLIDRIRKARIPQKIIKYNIALGLMVSFIVASLAELMIELPTSAILYFTAMSLFIFSRPLGSNDEKEE